MITPAGNVHLFDGMAALAGVSSRATVRQPASEVAPSTPSHRREPDRVELSPQACEDCEQDEREREEIEQLRKQDSAVRSHEQAHKAAAGSHAGPVSYTYTTGPDGKRYAVAGEVPIDVTPVEGDPEATIAKMQQVRSAALAPAEPSDADREVAAKARQVEREARAEKQGQVDVYA